jgi:hypothetical protein
MGWLDEHDKIVHVVDDDAGIFSLALRASQVADSTLSGTGRLRALRRLPDAVFEAMCA